MDATGHGGGWLFVGGGEQIREEGWKRAGGRCKSSGHPSTVTCGCPFHGSGLDESRMFNFQVCILKDAAEGPEKMMGLAAQLPGS